MDIRRNLYRLSAAAVTQLTDALNTLKNDGRYDGYIHLHHEAMMRPSLMPGEAGTGRNSAHMGPAFGPWHRRYLRDLELDLQTVVPGITLPYWDWATDAATPNPTAAPLWSTPYFGGDGAGPNDVVPNGPFTGWTALLMQSGGSMTLVPRSFPGLVRQLARAGIATLPRGLDVTSCLQESPYDSAPWSEAAMPSFRNRLEGWLFRAGDQTGPRMHNRVHVWVGGDMQFGTSPNDPVFFLHHANVDRLWAKWQASAGAAAYAPISGGPPGHNLNDAMFDLGAPGTTPASVLDHYRMGYMYDSEGVGFEADACGPTPMLTVARGQMVQIMACYTNTGTTAWTKGTATQVNLGQFTPAPFFAPWATGWLSNSDYATTTTALVAPGQMGYFVFAVTPPASTAPGQYTLEGELILAGTRRPLLAPTFSQQITVQ